MIQMGAHAIDRARWDWKTVEDNPFRCPDPRAAEDWAARLEEVRRTGSSLGAVIEVAASGVRAGLGAPIYGKLDADLAAAMMGINAVKGVEIGAGFAAAGLTGEENADEMRMRGGKPAFLSNNAGGILGGISTGQDILVRFAVKPTSSILVPRRTITVGGANAEIANPRAARPPASASARCRWARRWWPACSPTTCSCTAPRTVSARPGNGPASRSRLAAGDKVLAVAVRAGDRAFGQPHGPPARPAVEPGRDAGARRRARGFVADDAALADLGPPDPRTGA